MYKINRLKNYGAIFILSFPTNFQIISTCFKIGQQMYFLTLTHSCICVEFWMVLNFCFNQPTHPPPQPPRYCDQWRFVTQRIVYFAVLTVFLEAGFLVTRDTTAEILGCKSLSKPFFSLLLVSYIICMFLVKSNQSDGFPLDIEDYLMGVLNVPSELVRRKTILFLKLTRIWGYLLE